MKQDEKKRAQELPEKDNITAPAAADPGEADEKTFVDPDTGTVFTGEVSEDQRKRLRDAFVTAANNSTSGQRLRDAVNEIANSIVTDSMRELLREMNENLQPIQELLEELESLDPFIKAEFKEKEYSADYFTGEYTPAELLKMASDPESIFHKVLEAARKAKAEAERVTIQRTDDIEYPLDKISGKAWNIFTENTDGQLAITFDLLPKKQNLQATAYYSINFESLGDNVKITKRLLPFDKRVYIAVSALFNAGNDIITATQISYAMGNTKKPSQNQISKIDDALSKMTGARITLDNRHEHDALKGKYPLFQYDGSLLPIERMTAIINGQVTESAIHIFREPPLMTFAKERKQVTTIDVALLQSPVSKTDANLLIDDYLIDRISKAKNGKGSSCRILFKTLYEHAGIKATKQKQRAPEKIKKYLTYYQQQGFIKKYTMQVDGITVNF